MAPATKKLTSKETAFVAAYLGGAARGNGAKAAVLAGYAKGSAKVTASRLLRKPNVKLALANFRDGLANQAAAAAHIVQSKVMSGEEALERLTLYARADIGRVLGENDPLSKLPDEVRATIKSVRPSRYGRTIELHDSMRATELLAKAGGKLKEILQVESLEELIAKSMQAPSGAAA